MRRITGYSTLVAAVLALACEDRNAPSGVQTFDGPPSSIIYLSTLKVQINGEWHCLRTAGDSIRMKLGTTEGFWASVDGSVPITSTEDDDLPFDNQGAQERENSGSGVEFLFNEGVAGQFRGEGVRLDSVIGENGGYLSYLHYNGSTQVTSPAPFSGNWASDNSGSVRFGAYNSSPVCPTL